MGILFFPFRSLNPWFGMIFISFLTGLLMIIVFRTTSNQEGIRNIKNKIKAHLLELRLYKDNMSLSLKAQGQIFRCNLKYIGYSAKPMLAMVVPLILLLTQLNLWFGSAPLVPGQAAVLKLKLTEGPNPLRTDLSVESSFPFRIETLPLRIEGEREVNWRLRAQAEGMSDLIFRMDGISFTKKIVSGHTPLSPISAKRVKRNFAAEFLSPGEKPFPSRFPVESIEIAYPARRMNFFGWRLHWIVVYFVLSVIFGFALKRPFKVEI